MLPVYRTPLHVFNYDEIPPGYYYEAMQSGGAAQRFWHRKKFEAVAKHLAPNARVLDLGCGPGSFLRVLAETWPQADGTGVDIASPQIEFATQRVAREFPGRVRFQQISAHRRQLPFEAGQFDAVTSIEVIEHLHPYVAYHLFEDVKRVLKPDGKLIVTTPNYRSLWPFIERLLERLSPVKYHEQHINKFTPNSLVKFLESMGFDVTGLESIFVAAPFLAPLNWGLAEAVLAAEQKIPARLGSLLIAEARVADFLREKQ